MAEWSACIETGDSTLQALLAFVDDFERADGVRKDSETRASGSSPAEIDESSHRQDVTTLPGTALDSTSKTSAPKKADSCKRRREELARLRSQIGDLEFQLGALQRRKCESESEANAISSVGLRSSLGSIWAEIAQRQYEQRQRAEQENIRLRHTVDQQRDLATTLAHLVKKRTSAQVEGCEAACKRLCPAAEDLRLEADQAERDLTEMLGEMYAQLDTTFTDPVFSSIETHFSDAQLVTNQDSGEVSVEIKIAHIYPFDLDVTSTAVWQCMEQAPAGRTQTLTLHGDTMIRSFAGHMDESRRTMNVRGKTVARRYIEADRVVILSAEFWEPIDAKGRPWQGFRARHLAWRVLQCPRDCKAFPPDVTATQLQFRQVITAENRAPDSVPFIPQDESISEYATRVFNAKRDAGQRSIENMLMQLSLKD